MPNLTRPPSLDQTWAPAQVPICPTSMIRCTGSTDLLGHPLGPQDPWLDLLGTKMKTPNLETLAFCLEPTGATLSDQPDLLSPRRHRPRHKPLPAQSNIKPRLKVQSKAPRAQSWGSILRVPCLGCMELLDPRRNRAVRPTPRRRM